MCVVFDITNCLWLHRKMRPFCTDVTVAYCVCMSRAYTSYTTIRCGNRKMAERNELIFTMETDSPVLDGIMGVQIPKDEGLFF